MEFPLKFVQRNEQFEFRVSQGFRGTKAVFLFSTGYRYTNESVGGDCIIYNIRENNY